MIKNKTLIVPAAGNSSRFPDMKPKWLLAHPYQDLMISKILTEELVNSYSKIYITILQNHIEQYDALTILHQMFKERQLTNCEVVVLDNPTSSASETVYNTIKQKNIKGPITIKDSDCIVEFNNPTSLNFIVGLNINKHSINNPGSKSYLIKDEHNSIQDIVENNVVSNHMCTGVYSLNKSSDFLIAYETLKNSKLFIGVEIYVSHVFSYLIQKQKINAEYIECDTFTDWGTLQDWRNEQEKYKTYIFDIDGVIVENVGPYGTKTWYNSLTPIEENVKILKQLSDKGNQIIFMTARNKEGIVLIKQMLDEYKIKYHKIITDCYHSQRIIVNDYANTNPYPSCKSISIKRNESLKPYLSL